MSCEIFTFAAVKPLMPPKPPKSDSKAVITLAYELLDAHADTLQLQDQAATATEWEVHRAYVRDLQRVGRGVIARAVVDEFGPWVAS